MKRICVNNLAYGAKKSMYGKNFMGVHRSTYIIDIDIKIIKIWPKVKVDGHAQDVLNSVKALGAQ